MIRFLILVMSLALSSAAFADCPNCRGQQAPEVQSYPNVGVVGSSMKVHLERTHGINTAGMTPAQMQEAHNKAHYGPSVRVRSRAVIRTAPVRRFLFRFR